MYGYPLHLILSGGGRRGSFTARPANLIEDLIRRYPGALNQGSVLPIVLALRALLCPL